MAVIRKSQSFSNIAKKKESKNISVSLTRQPSQIEEMADVDFGTLDASKDGLIVSYDSNSNRFVLKTADQLLQTSSEDGDLPDEFVRSLEGELNLGQIQLETLDGGSF